MEVLDFNLTLLRNEEHHKFHADFSELINRFSPETLGVQTFFPHYSELFNAEGDALNFIRKNDITDDLVQSDLERDTTLRGFAAAIKSACNHFNADKRKAGERIQIMLDGFGTITAKSYESETSAINSLVSKLTRDYASEIALLGVNEWLDELLAQNTAFTDLSNRRYTSETAKSQYRMKETRREVDAAYKTIVKRLNALIEINGPDVYLDFTKEINLRIEKYTTKRASKAASPVVVENPTTETPVER